MITSEEAISCIEDVLNSDYHYDESLGYQLTSDDFEWLEKAKAALEMTTHKFVTCPKGFRGVRNTRFYCPTCKSLTRQRELFCHSCGQALKYPKEVIEDGKFVFDWTEE